VGRIDTEIARLNKEIDSTQEKVDGIATEDTQRGDSQALMRRLNNAKREKQTYEKERKAINDRLAEIRKAGHTSEVVREDFNTFLGRQFKTEPGRVEFGMAAAPAILLDVVAPILSAVALFL
jgi:predicted  nucleic acid-binding Zn-ribbon protein